jgi:hypothetical protein
MKCHQEGHWERDLRRCVYGNTESMDDVPLKTHDCASSARSRARDAESTRVAKAKRQNKPVYPSKERRADNKKTKNPVDRIWGRTMHGLSVNHTHTRTHCTMTGFGPYGCGLQHTLAYWKDTPMDWRIALDYMHMVRKRCQCKRNMYVSTR